jgi:GNAT superfamily N-acetyltransferase
MHPLSILDLYDQEMRRDAPSRNDTVLQWPGLTLISLSSSAVVIGWIIYTQLKPAEADKAIQAVIDFFRPKGGEIIWKIYGSDNPPDLGKRLTTHGFAPEDVDSLLALDLEEVPAQFWEPYSAEVERLSSTEQLDAIARIEAAVWNNDFGGLKAALTAEMEEMPNRISVFIAASDGLPASGAWIRYYPGRQFAELYGGATLPDQRGKGLYSSLVKARAQEARRRGVRFLMVDTTPMSRAVCEKLGFVYLTNVQRFSLDLAGGQPPQKS